MYMFVYTVTLVCQLYIVNNNNNNNSNNSFLQVNFINPKTTRKQLSKAFIKRSEKHVPYLEDLVFLNLNIKVLLTTFFKIFITSVSLYTSVQYHLKFFANLSEIRGK